MDNLTRLKMRERVSSRMDIEDRGYDSPCWISNRVAQPNGYTKIGYLGKTLLVHRVSYEAFVGDIPEGMVIDHLCRVRACCNPQHLEVVTPIENQRRSDVTFMAVNATKTHCPQGHPLSGDNLYRRPDRPNNRGCRACRNVSRRAKRLAA